MGPKFPGPNSHDSLIPRNTASGRKLRTRIQEREGEVSEVTGTAFQDAPSDLRV